jgi:hypothetical protein
MKGLLLLTKEYWFMVAACLSALLAGTTPLADATDNSVPKISASVLGMPPASWSFVRQGTNGLEKYLIPTQLSQIYRLPEPDRSDSLRIIQKRQGNLSFLEQTIRPFFSELHTGNIHALPEYAMDLREVMMAIDFDNARDKNPLFEHEPLLLALPSYTRIVLFVPGAGIASVKERLNKLGLSERVKLVASQEMSRGNFGNGLTRWVRDAMFVANKHGVPLVMPSLAYENYGDLSHNDLGYLDRIAGVGHNVLRMPIFVEGGNLAVAKAGRKLLLVGAEEIAINQHWFSEAFGYQPPPEAVPNILKAVTGADEVVILPNSRNLFHLDMFIAPLADGIVGLLAPIDPDHLTPLDRDVLIRSADMLKGLGFHVVSIPTSAERIRNFESPANIVSFVDRRTGRHRALVPQFPEPIGISPSQSLNAQALAAYRHAGVDPIPVEDRFHPFHGNVHCAMVALH